jgi:hypothetical protein
MTVKTSQRTERQFLMVFPLAPDAHQPGIVTGEAHFQGVETIVLLKLRIGLMTFVPCCRGPLA